MTKTLILAVTACILLVSCSTSDNTEPQIEDEITVDDNQDNPIDEQEEEDGEVTEINLSYSVFKIFEDGMLFRTDTTKFADNKPIETVRYNSEGAQVNTTIWYYLQNGLFDSLQTQLPNGLIKVQEKVEYDSEDRLIKWVFSELVDNRTFKSTELYSYPTENLILTESPDGNASETTFELNADGLIFKETNGNEINEVVWDQDYNPIQLTSEDGAFTYELLENPLKKDYLSNYWINIFKSKNNFILWSNRFHFSPPELTFGNKYIAVQNGGGLEYEYLYDFDDDGILLKQTTLANGMLQSETEYFYEK